MIAFIHKADHGIHIVKQTEAKRFELESDVHFLLFRIIPDAPAGLDAPLPLGCRRNDFALPHVLAKDEEHIFSVPGFRQIDELFCALDVELANGRAEINEAERANWKRDDWETQLVARLCDGLYLLGSNADRLGVDIDTVKTDA